MIVWMTTMPMQRAAGPSANPASTFKASKRRTQLCTQWCGVAVATCSVLLLLRWELGSGSAPAAASFGVEGGLSAAQEAPLHPYHLEATILLYALQPHACSGPPALCRRPPAAACPPACPPALCLPLPHLPVQLQGQVQARIHVQMSAQALRP